MTEIERYCANPHDMNILSKDAKQLLIQACFRALAQKAGNQEKAISILLANKEIKNLHGYTIYSGKKFLWRDPVESLTRIGVVTIQVINPDDLALYQERFRQTIDEFREFCPEQKHDFVRVLGGFAAYGNPSSFHNNLVRELRMKCWKKVSPFFKKYISTYYNKRLRSGLKLEALIDRMMFRQKGQAPVAEAWHRDVTPPPNIGGNDEIFGGWLNLNTTNQYMSCLAGSHLGVSLKKIPSGFDTMTKRETAKEQNKNMTKKEIAAIVKERIKEVGRYRTKFTVPPGCIIIFPQYIMHEVVATKSKHDMYRLFNGWRLTTRSKPLYPIQDMLDNQGIPRLPGGMYPPMYSMNHISNWQGMPVVKRREKKIDWVTKTGDVLLLLANTKEMRKLGHKKRTKKVVIDMVEEYMKTYNIRFKVDRDLLLSDDKMSLTVKAFRPSPQSELSNLISWSNNFVRRQALETKKYKKNQGEYMVIDRHMKSLKEYGFSMYPEYSKSERIIYSPVSLSK
jgi:hypothetical protein